VVEQFGFEDGISQPLMIQQDIDKEIAERGSTHWDPSAPLSLALTPEPGAAGNYGSFMVFRKLEQNVKGFWTSVEQLSAASGIALDKSGALAVGRFQDGTPLLPTKIIQPGAALNDFHYDQDPNAIQCPFHAHIRKTNPRGDVPRKLGAPAAFERSRRIVRRGITYGNRPDIGQPAGGARPETGAGLLFMCFQSNLDQFAIQQEGSDANGFIVDDTGVDAVIGQNSAPVAQTWPGNIKHTMANFVKMLGGEYFFAPSINFLTSL
jgi:deferrochelatase/peroxidase EfeB